jgi:hypothetical protein
MSNFDSDGSSENQWEDRGELAWNEFDWERYLREQDELLRRYQDLYDACPEATDRLDRVAEQMNWGPSDWSEEADSDDSSEGETESAEVYTVYKNPIFIATKAISRSLRTGWEALSADPSRVPQPLAVALLAAFQRCEDQALQGVHALDFGDYAMAVSLLKRALSQLNGCLALLGEEAVAPLPEVRAWRTEAMRRCFDLREIWLRVIAECRDELSRPLDDES